MKIKNYESQVAQQNRSKATNQIKQQAKISQADRSSEDAQSASSVSTAEFSARAKEMGKAKKVAMEANDIRESKIAELRRRIANKEYNVKPDEIADKMVDEHFRTRDLG